MLSRSNGPRAVAILGSLLATTLLAASIHCGSSSGTGPSSAAVADDGRLTTITQSGTVMLPAGMSVAPGALTVASSYGAGAVSASGAFSVETYAPGSQLVLVLSPAGTPMLAAWLDAAHPVIDVVSTAQVLLWIAAGGPTLPAPAQAPALAALPATAGLDQVALALAAALAASPDALAAPHAAIHAAMAKVLVPFALDVGAQVTPLDLSIDPAASAPQSGVSLTSSGTTESVETGVSGLWTAALPAEADDPPNAAHVSNAYRRRAMAYVERVSHTVGPTTSAPIADPLDVTSFEVWPTNGLNAGYVGAFTSIFNSWNGAGSSAYAAVNSPRNPVTNATMPFTMPPVDGASKTTYRVTVVGPGETDGKAFAALTPAQYAGWTEICVRGWVQDALLPLVANVLFGNSIAGSGVAWSAGTTGGLQGFYVSLAKNVTKEIIGKLPKLVPLLQKYKWNDAFQLMTKDPMASGTVRAIVETAVTRYLMASEMISFKDAQAANVLKSVNTIITGMGFGMQVFDTTVMSAQRGYEHYADAWDVDVITSKVKLRPASAVLGVGQQMTLEASISDAPDLSDYAFHWTNTATAGDLVQVSGGNVHGADFCASAGTLGAATAKVEYVSQGHEGTDRIGVEVFPKGQKCCAPASATCVPGKPLGHATSTVVVAPVLLSPKAAKMGCGQSRSFKVTLPNAGIPDGALTSHDLVYSYTCSASFGHLGVSGFQPQDNFDSPSDLVYYTVNAGAQPGGTETITAKVFLSDADAGEDRLLGEATSKVQVGPTCASSPGYIGGPNYGSTCTTKPAIPAVVVPGQKVDVTVQVPCSGGATVYMSLAVSASVDGGPLQKNSGSPSLYDYCYWGVPQPVVAAGAYAAIPNDNLPHTVSFVIDPALQCPVCVVEDSYGGSCWSSPGNKQIVSGAAVSLVGVGGSTGWSTVSFFELAVSK